jgi:hypothetical protein
MSKQVKNKAPEAQGQSEDVKRKNYMSDPEKLIENLSKSHFFRMLVYAVLIHILICVLTSFGFIALCVKYHSLHPREIIKEQEKIAAENKAKEDAAKAAEEASKLAKAAAEDARKNPKPAAKEPPKEGAGATEGGENQPDKKKSKIEQEVEKTSTERPKGSSMGLDITPDLE